MSQISLNRHIFEAGDYLKEIESSLTWFSKSLTGVLCFSCRRQIEVSALKTPKGCLCKSCALSTLRAVAENIDFSVWPPVHFKESLSAEGRLSDRLTVLWRFVEVRQAMMKRNSSDIQKLMPLLVNNLGYMQFHPLDREVRQAAYEACIAAGKTILPLLLEMCDSKPWEFYANVVMAAGSIAPDDKNVRLLLEKAAMDSNPGIRIRVLYAISNHKSPWADKLLQTFNSDSDPAICRLAPEIIAKREKIEENTVSKKIAIPEDPYQLKIESIVNKLYSPDALKKIYKCYLHHFFDKKSFNIVGKFSINKIRKNQLVRALTNIYCDKKLFQRLLTYIPDDAKKILNILVWEGGMHEVEKLEKMFKSEIIKDSEAKQFLRKKTIQDSYLLFQIRKYSKFINFSDVDYNYSFFLVPEFRELFKNYLPHPEDYDLIELDSVNEKTDFIYADNNQITRQIILFCTYIQQGYLKFSKNGDNILKTSILKMNGYCNVKEFYDNKDKDLQFLRTQIIADFLKDAEFKSKENAFVLLKEIFDNFFYNKGFKNFELKELLYYLKGTYFEFNQSYEKRQEKVKTSLLDLLKKLPLQKWVSAENIIKYVSYRNIFMEIVDKSYAWNNLYYHKKVELRRQYSTYEKVSISDRIYKDVIITPFIKAVFFLFASFGIVDIAYNYPENKFFQDKNKEYLSFFDGLKYVRLTELGAYITGTATGYKAEFKEKGANLILDEKRLIINIKGDDPLKKLMLEKISDKISRSCYKINYHSFLKECYSTADIKRKITFFREQISADPPQIWIDFLDEILNKTNPLAADQEMVVYKLNQQNDELISLIAKDKILKKYILKAENYHIIIAKKNLGKVKKRLEEFGYFIERMYP